MRFTEKYVRNTEFFWDSKGGAVSRLRLKYENSPSDWEGINAMTSPVQAESCPFTCIHCKHFPQHFGYDDRGCSQTNFMPGGKFHCACASDGEVKDPSCRCDNAEHVTCAECEFCNIKVDEETGEVKFTCWGVWNFREEEHEPDFACGGGIRRYEKHEFNFVDPEFVLIQNRHPMFEAEERVRHWFQEHYEEIGWEQPSDTESIEDYLYYHKDGSRRKNQEVERAEHGKNYYRINRDVDAIRKAKRRRETTPAQKQQCMEDAYDGYNYFVVPALMCDIPMVDEYYKYKSWFAGHREIIYHYLQRQIEKNFGDFWKNLTDEEKALLKQKLIPNYGAMFEIMDKYMEIAKERDV